MRQPRQTRQLGTYRTPKGRVRVAAGDAQRILGDVVETLSMAVLQEAKLEVAREVFRVLPPLTPVLTGRLRASLKASYGPRTTFKDAGPGTHGPPDVRQVEQDLAGMHPHDRLRFSYGPRYAARIEFYGWSSKKAPDGWVRIGMNQVASSRDQILARAVEAAGAS